VVLQPRRSALSAADLACAERGLAELARGLWRLGEDIGRELYLQTGLLRGDGLPGLEVAALPAQLVELPEDLVGNRTHLLVAALRARGRRAVITPAFSRASSREAEPALSRGGSRGPANLAVIARHLVWGAVLFGAVLLVAYEVKVAYPPNHRYFEPYLFAFLLAFGPIMGLGMSVPFSWACTQDGSTK
jgi:hypothetical protein